MSRTGFKKIKIFRDVIFDVLVNMMDYFFRIEKSFKNRFCNQSMFLDKAGGISERMARFINANISLINYSSSTFPALTFRAKMCLSVFFISLFSMFFAKKMATMISAYFSTVFKWTLGIYHTFVIAGGRAKNFFISSLSCWSGIKRFSTHWAYV